MALAEKDVLFVVDCDNIFRSAQSAYGNNYRVSYVKLIEFVKKCRPPDLNYHMAVFATLKSGVNTQLSFVSRLSQLGFDIHTFLSEYDEVSGEVRRHDFSEDMIHFIRDFRCHGDDYPQHLIVASSSGAYTDLYIGLAYLGVNLEVLYIGDKLAQRVRDVKGLKTTILGDEVLFHV